MPTTAARLPPIFSDKGAVMDKAILIHLSRNAKEKRQAEESMEELEGLVKAAGAAVADKIFQVKPSVSARTFIG